MNDETTPVFNIEDTEGEFRYNVYLCFEWMNMDSCVEFTVEYSHELLEDEYESAIDELIEVYGPYTHISDENMDSVVNLSQFKQCFIERVDGIKIKPSSNIISIH